MNLIQRDSLPQMNMVIESIFILKMSKVNGKIAELFFLGRFFLPT